MKSTTRGMSMLCRWAKAATTVLSLALVAPAVGGAARAEDQPTTDPVAGSTASTTTDEPKRTAVPAVAEQERARAVVRDLFKAEFGKRDAASKSALAKTLLAQASLETSKDGKATAARYALLKEAGDAAAAAGDPATAMETAEQLAEAFEIDLPARKTELLVLLPRTADAGATIAAAAGATEEAILAERFDAGARAASVANAAAARVKDKDRAARGRGLPGLVERARKAYSAAEAAKQALVKAPDNAEANLTLGRYLCFDRGDWKSGLPCLAKGSDATLKALAGQESPAPSDAAAMAALADGWWSAADAAKEEADGPRRQRATHWYGAAMPRLDGIKKMAAQSRVAATESARGSARPANRKGNLVARMKPTDSVKVERDGDALHLSGNGRLMTPDSYEVPMEVTVVASTDSTNLRVYAVGCEVIFNWELNQSELRFHGPPDGQISAAGGKGSIPKDTMVTVVWRITPTTATIIVDGRERASFKRDFSTSTGPVGVAPAAGSEIRVRSVRVDGKVIRRK